MKRPPALQRILANDKTETEHWNDQRADAGRDQTGMLVTKMRPGLTSVCGCEIDTVHYGHGFSKQHRPEVCDMGWDYRESTPCTAAGQAVGRVVDIDGIEYMGVMELSGVWPHEESAL